MNLRVTTIVLDGMPWITAHLPIFNRLPFHWEWHIAHGVSAPVRDTRWIQPQLPRLSNDGTSEYLDLMSSQHPRVRVFSRKIWEGKTAMCNACLEGIQPGTVVMQVDADEIWDPYSIEAVVRLFEERHHIDRMQFFCRYHVGPNIVITTRDGNTYGCRGDEWMRAWRIRRADQRFVTHEPPLMGGCGPGILSRKDTFDLGIEFDHFAYATQAQVEQKERIYGYEGATMGWLNLQRNKVWPTKLKPFMPWVDDRAMADLAVQ